MFRAWAIGCIITALVIAEVAHAAATPPERLVPFASERSLLQFLKSNDRRERDSDGKPIDAFFFSGPGYAMNQAAEPRADGGGLVHRVGDTLLVLRRGRLYSLSIVSGAMRVIDSIAITPAGVKTGRDDAPNYFDMLVSGDTLVVMGTCSPGDTAIVRLRLAPNGHLAYLDAHQVSTFGGPTSLNYALRFVNGRLVYYTARVLGSGDPVRERPAIRAWTPRSDGEYQPIGSAQDYFASSGPDNGWTLHALISCDVKSDDMHCRGSGAFAAPGRNFFMSDKALYVWTAESYDCWSLTEKPCVVYRLPLDGTPPTALEMRGSPRDQQSVAEDAMALTVLMAADYQSADIFGPGDRHGAVAIARIPLSSFNAELHDIPIADYRQLPRFADTGDHYYYGRLDLGFPIYGTGDIEFIPPDEPKQKHQLTIAPSATGEVATFPLDPGIDHIAAMGTQAVVLGHQGKAVLARVMNGAIKTLSDPLPLPGIGPSDVSGWNLDIRYDGASRLLTVPVGLETGDDKIMTLKRALGIAFLRYSAKGFENAGELDAKVSLSRVPDQCESSCYQWYDDVTPVITGDRVLAVLGYEVIESRLQDGKLHEISRLNFTPR